MKVKNISEKRLHLKDYSIGKIVTILPGEEAEGQFGNYPELQIVKDTKKKEEE